MNSIDKIWFYSAEYGPTSSGSCGHDKRKALRWLRDARKSHMSFSHAEPLPERLIKTVVLKVYMEQDLL